jgi:membrane protein
MAKSIARRTPLWAVGLGVLLNATGVTRGRSTDRRRRASDFLQRRLERSRDTPTAGTVHDENTGGDRGRHASTPAQIPARGWKDILLRIFHGIGEDRILAISAGVTFFVLLAIFPAIAGLIALYGLYAEPQTISQHLNAASGVLPEGGLQIVREQVERLTSQPSRRLGLATLVGLAIALWSANGGMKALFDALNVVYHEKEKRGFLRLNAISLTFTLGAMLFVLVAFAAMTVLPVVLNSLGLSRATELLVKIGRWPVLFLAVSFAITLIYRFGTSRDKPKWRWITPGSIFAAAIWLAASLMFSWYTENFGKYNETYGSLGAAIGFMTWLWISTMVILIGAKLNAEIEHQTANDTTVGESRPVGQRGARMADSVGAAR